MAITMTQSSRLDAPESSSASRLSAFKRYVLRRVHPVSMFIEMAGLIWFVYYFWNHLWQEALIVLVGTRIVANVAVFRANAEALAQTALGRIALLHLHGINLALQLVGVIGLFYGLWTHETRVILAGGSLVFLGHLKGWAQVDKRFSLDG